MCGLPPRAAQQVEFLETLNLVQMAVPLRPDALELDLLALDDVKAVHGDKHIALRSLPIARFQADLYLRNRCFFKSKSKAVALSLGKVNCK